MVSLQEALVNHTDSPVLEKAKSQTRLRQQFMAELAVQVKNGIVTTPDQLRTFETEFRNRFETEPGHDFGLHVARHQMRDAYLNWNMYGPDPELGKAYNTASELLFKVIFPNK